MRTLSSARPTDRVGRYPKHPFTLTAERPFIITPMMIAPVLPGDSLATFYMEARSITDPVVNPIIGWKKEYFFYYVKMSDLLNDAIKDMFVDPDNVDLRATYGVGANDAPFFTAKGDVPWAKWCYQRIVEAYFRDDGEVYTDQNVGGLAVAQIKDILWMDSLTDESEFPEGDDIADATTMQDLQALRNAFDMLQTMGLAQMTYEDYLKMSGVPVPESARVGRPEELFHFSSWQYPANTIDPSNGTPRSAVSWLFKETERKAKQFREPGFIMGLTLTRPKVYMGGQYGNASAALSRAWDWIPAYLPDDGSMNPTRLKNYAAGTGPLGDRSGTSGGIESEYWFDTADVFVHGDQWRDVVLDNIMTPVPAHHIINRPSWGGGEDALALRYLTDATLKAFFVDSAGTKYNIRSDGVVNLGLKGKVVDVTQTAFSVERAS